MTPRRLSSLRWVSSSRVDESSSRWLLWLNSPNCTEGPQKIKYKKTWDELFVECVYIIYSLPLLTRKHCMNF